MNLVALGIGAIIGAGIFVLTAAVASPIARARPSCLRSSRGNRLRLRRSLLCRIRSMIPWPAAPTPMVCDHGRALRVDHRLGFDSRIRCRCITVAERWRNTSNLVLTTRYPHGDSYRWARNAIAIRAFTRLAEVVTAKKVPAIFVLLLLKSSGWD